MKRNPRADDAFINQQNKVRGLISDFKSRKFVKDRSSSHSSQFRYGIRQLLLDTRVDLNPGQFNAFLAWLNHQIAVQLPTLQNIPIGYEELSGIFTNAPKAPLECELLWITARLKADADKLNVFRQAANGLEQLVFSNRIEEAIESLKLIERVFGTSLWSVQLRIALEHQAGGLERQKRYTAEVRKVYRRGLLGFTTYHTSVRNEDRSTLAKYCDDVKERINNHQYYDSSVKAYALYRLAVEWPISENGFADILRVEQSHSLIDIYETFIAVAQEIVRRENLSELQGVLEKCLRNLRGINDFRLHKAALFIDTQQPLKEVFLPRNSSISDALFSGNCKAAARAGLDYIKSPICTDTWQFTYAGLALSHMKRPRDTRLSRPNDISQLIARILNRSDFSIDYFDQLKKLAVNFHGLPTGAGTLDLIPVLRQSRPEESWRPWLIGLNSPTIGIEEFSGNTEGRNKYSEVAHARGCPTEAAWQYFNGISNDDCRLSSIAVTLFKGAGLLRQEKYQDAIDTLISLKEVNSFEPIRAMVASMLLHAFFAQGNRPKVIELIANEGARGEAIRKALPVLATLEHYDWTDFKTVSEPLVTPIALHLLWSINENDATASYLRFATSAMLRHSGVDRPSKLFDVKDAYPHHQLVYFLREICISNILDVSRILKSSREVMEERQAICAVLRQLDQSHSQEYHDEILSISNALAMDDGQWIVDRTRVYVDIDALSRWATKALSEDYARYRDLLGVNIGTSQNFDDVLKELASATPSQRSSYNPENEADAVLVSILRRLGDEFLNNPNFGFDFYLSKRIRHQSFIGLIRGPLEFANLITTRDSELGEYHRNDQWLDKFTSLSSNSEEAFNNALVKFSKTFDDTLIDAKDHSFHVLSHENPRGLLFLDLSPQLIVLARAIVQMDTSPSEFIQTSISLLWAALEPSLAIARRFIGDELKTKIAGSFDELRATIRHIAEQDPAFLEFDVEIGKCSTEVQRALDDVATWFSHADLEAQKRYFCLDQIVDIALDATLKCQRAFEPEIIREVNGDVQLSASNLVFVHDVLFVALTNARAHSGYKKPKINIFVNASLENGTLSIEVKSDAKPQSRAAQEDTIREIRQIIDSGNLGRRTRSEGRSGFLKLAAVVRQTSKGNIEFGFLNDNKFRLKVTYSLIVLETSSREPSNA